MTLAKCKSCGVRLDPFVELEFPLIALELMLHRVPAFRHVLCNRVLEVSIWLRFALVINLIEVLAHFWITRKDPTLDEVVVHLTQSLIVFTSSLMCFCTCVTLLSSKPFASLATFVERTGCQMRALILSRFPSLLLVVAMAWWYPSDFYPVIALYTFSTSIAAARALPEIDSMWKASLVAFCGVIPRIMKAVLTAGDKR